MGEAAAAVAVASAMFHRPVPEPDLKEEQYVLYCMNVVFSFVNH